jgi:hypothetical protein
MLIRSRAIRPQTNSPGFAWNTLVAIDDAVALLHAAARAGVGRAAGLEMDASDRRSS